MNIKTRNPVWTNAEQTMIDCELEHPQYGWIPFSASPTDVELHGREIFAALAAGEVGPYVSPPETETETEIQTDSPLGPSGAHI